MDTGRRDFYAKVVWESRSLSKCECPEAAIVVREHNQVAIAVSENLVKNVKTSPIQDVLLDSAGLLFPNKIEDVSIFSTYPPNYYELLLILRSGIKSIYFFGDINDVEASKLLILMNKDSKFQDIKISCLK
jgi:hypothetical protein